MKITKVEADNRKRAFVVTTRRGTFGFPYKRCDPSPGPLDRLAEVYVDPELGREAFTYRLESGAEGSVHIDSVLDVNADPDYLARLEVYQLTIDAKRRVGSSGLSARRGREAWDESCPALPPPRCDELQQVNAAASRLARHRRGHSHDQRHPAARVDAGHNHGAQTWTCLLRSQRALSRRDI